MQLTISLYFVGWTDEVKNEMLFIYKLEVSSKGPEVTLSVTVASDFSWTVSYRGQHISRENCSILRSAPSEVNTGKALKFE